MTKQVAAIKGALAAQEQPQTLDAVIRAASAELGKALPAHLNPERLVRIALTAVRLNPELSKATPASFLGALFVLGQLGLEPINGQAYLLPFNNRKKVGNDWKTTKDVVAVIGFKGYVSLFYRHQNAISLDVQTVHANDEFSYAYGTDPYLKHVPAIKERGEVLGFYACARLSGGGNLFRFMSAEETTAHGKAHSKTVDKNTGQFYSSSPWATEWESMSKKTVLIQLAKLLPLSVELSHAISADESSRDYRAGIGSAFDLPITTGWEHAEEPAPEPAPIPEKPPVTKNVTTPPAVKPPVKPQAAPALTPETKEDPDGPNAANEDPESFPNFK